MLILSAAVLCEIKPVSEMQNVRLLVCEPLKNWACCTGRNYYSPGPARTSRIFLRKTYFFRTWKIQDSWRWNLCQNSCIKTFCTAIRPPLPRSHVEGHHFGIRSMISKHLNISHRKEIFDNRFPYSIVSIVSKVISKFLYPSSYFPSNFPLKFWLLLLKEFSWKHWHTYSTSDRGGCVGNIRNTAAYWRGYTYP